MANSSPKKHHRIVWAVDAFDESLRANDVVRSALNALAREKEDSVEIVPIYVLSPGEINLSIEFMGPWLEQYRTAAEKALRKAIRGLKIRCLGQPRVIAENFTSTAQAAKTLADQAAEMNAEMIVVTTHGRRGLGRFLMGSFAESLIDQSHVPILILRQKMKAIEKIRTILMPTAFGVRAKLVFRQVVEQARRMGARVILFHTIPHPIEPMLQSGAYLAGGSWIPVQAYFSSDTHRHRRRADAWGRWAEHQGVPCEVIVEVQGTDIGHSILYLAETRKVDCVAMESKTGPVVSALLGSITRQVIRNAPCPVWVYRPLRKAPIEKRIPRVA